MFYLLKHLRFLRGAGAQKAVNASANLVVSLGRAGMAGRAGRAGMAGAGLAGRQARPRWGGGGARCVGLRIPSAGVGLRPSQRGRWLWLAPGGRGRPQPRITERGGLAGGRDASARQRGGGLMPPTPAIATTLPVRGVKMIPSPYPLRTLSVPSPHG